MEASTATNGPVMYLLSPVPYGTRPDTPRRDTPSGRRRTTAPGGGQTTWSAAGDACSDRLFLQALGDHRGDAVTAHGHPVERIGNLHGALLVGDDDQLGLVTQLAEDLQQPAQVRVVQGRLDLVHQDRKSTRLNSSHVATSY